MPMVAERGSRVGGQRVRQLRNNLSWVIPWMHRSKRSRAGGPFAVFNPAVNLFVVVWRGFHARQVHARPHLTSDSVEI